MGFSLPDDVGYPTTQGYVKHHNRRSRKILKRQHAKKNRARSFDQEELLVEKPSGQMYLSTRGMSEKDHHLSQKGKDICRDTIRKTASVRQMESDDT